MKLKMHENETYSIMQTFILSDCDSPVNMIYYKYLTNYNMCTQMTNFNMFAHYLKQ